MTDFATLGFKADTSGLKKAQSELQATARHGKKTETALTQAAKNPAQSFVSLSSAIKLAGGALAAMGVAQQFNAIVHESEQLQRNMLRTEQLVKSTGRAASTSAAELHQQARQLALATLGSTEGIMEAQQTLLTFKNVSTDSFNEVTERALDLATVTGGSLSGAMNQLGRALENPVQGINAMTRSGVSFSQAQKDVIASLVEAGDVAGAQRVILDELAGQYGGVAKREALGLAGAQDTLGQAIQEARIAIGEQSGVIDLMADSTNKLAETIFDLTAAYQAGEFDTQLEILRFTATAAAATAVAYGTLTTATTLYTARAKIATVVQWGLNAAMAANPVGLAAAGIGALAAAMIHVSQSAKRSADELDRVSAKAREYRTLVDTIGTAERAQRVESLKSEIERLVKMNDVNFLLEQRATHFERARELEKQGYADNAAAHKRIVADLNERIANTDNLTERIKEMRKELEQLTGEQGKNNETPSGDTGGAVAAEADKMIERLEREVALYGMTNEQQARYSILLAGGTDAQAERAAAMQAWIDKQDEAATATERLNDITQQQRDLQIQNMGAMAQEVVRYSQTLQAIEQLRADDEISHEEYLQAKHEAELAHAAQVKNIERDLAAARAESMKGTLGAMGQAFGNMAQIAKEGGKDQFDTWKAMATAQALVSTSLAIVNALTAGPIMGPILAGTIGALGAVQVAQIQAQEYQGSYLGGGYTGSGSRTGGLDGAGGFPAILHPNETVIDHTKGQSIGGTVVNVTPVFNIQGGGDDVRSQIMEALPMITQSVMGAVERAAGRGGSMSRAVGRR